MSASSNQIPLPTFPALPALMNTAAINEMADSMRSTASQLLDAANQVNDRWRRVPEVFKVAGADGAYSMLKPATFASQALANALNEGARVLRFLADELYWLERRRDALAGRVTSVLAAAVEGQRNQAEFDADVAPRVEALTAEIVLLAKTVDSAEQRWATVLAGITGGDHVDGPWGREQDGSLPAWGAQHGLPPGGNSRQGSLADQLERRLSNATADKVSELAGMSVEDATAWATAHPDFPAAVGLIDVNRAGRLWEGLEAGSTRADSDSGQWTSGPLATLFSAAPFAVGNLNGIPAKAKNEFNRETLRKMLAGEMGELGGEQRKQLEQVEGLLRDADKKQDPPADLLSLFLETNDGSPRTSIGFGDVDTADQVNTLTHGINTDTGNLPEWATSAMNLQRTTTDQLYHGKSDASVATVLFLEWDSGGKLEVHGIDRPDAGAERMAQTLRGFGQVNPGAQQNVQVHSLGTTMATQMIADNPGLVDNAWLYGSAGVTDQAAAAVKRQISDGDLRVFATQAGDDWVASLGRPGWSEHPVNPVEIDGVQSFSSDGGFVAGYGSGAGEDGERVHGHNSQYSEAWYYQFHPTVGWGGVLFDGPSRGYLDAEAQSFKQTVVDMAAAAETWTEE